MELRESLSQTSAVWMDSRASASKLASVMLGQIVLPLEIQLVENPLVLVAAFRRVVAAAGRSVCRRSATKARLRGLWWQSLGIRTALARYFPRNGLDAANTVNTHHWCGATWKESCGRWGEMAGLVSGVSATAVLPTGLAAVLAGTQSLAWPRDMKERAKGFEPSTSSLGS